jgi:predicted nucleotidyltransferase
MINKIKKVVKEILSSKRNSILAVYVFGSYAKGNEKSKSDVDIAVIFEERFYKRNPFEALQKAELFGAEISRELNKTVDIAVLNGSSLIFAYHTVKRGICIYGEDSTDRILYEVKLDNKYQDLIPFVRELRDIKRDALVGRNSG